MDFFGLGIGVLPIRAGRGQRNRSLPPSPYPKVSAAKPLSPAPEPAPPRHSMLIVVSERSYRKGEFVSAAHASRGEAQAANPGHRRGPLFHYPTPRGAKHQTLKTFIRLLTKGALAHRPNGAGRRDIVGSQRLMTAAVGINTPWPPYDPASRSDRRFWSTEQRSGYGATGAKQAQWRGYFRA